MFKALIVDDEIYAVMGIRSGVNWERLQVSEVYEAYNMRDALKVFEQTSIDVMICDIEMPKGTGIELLEKVNEISPETETIFLTAHSAFNFMKRAIQLDGFDYLLKPIEFDVLEDTINRALESILQERELYRLREQYKPYYEMWRRQKPLITDKFWNDLFTGRIVCSPNNIAGILEKHQLSGLEQFVFLPVLVSVESWLREFTTRDEEIIEYAIRKGAAEVLLMSGRGEVIQTKQGVNIVIMMGDQEEMNDPSGLHVRCEKYIQSCLEYFDCNISCYIGRNVSLYEIADICKQLLEIEYNNVNRSNQVYMLASHCTPSIQSMIPRISTWTILLEQGKLEELQEEIRIRVSEMAQFQRLSMAELEAFRNEFMQMAHYVLHKNGLNAVELLKGRDGLLLNDQPRSLPQLEEEALQVAGIIHNELHQNHSVIRRIQYYITEHLSEPITREQLASYVHLNPAYLSRLFKREIGESITDYILNTRMSLAKDLITTSTLPISDIAKTLGYYNFSYFSKMFRKVYDVSPQQLRQQSPDGQREREAL